MNTPSASLQNQYKELIAAKNFLELARVMERTKIPPADHVVRMGFKRYLQEAGGNKVRLFLLMKLMEITSIRPEETILKDACEIALSMDTPQILEALIKRMEIDKSVFNDMRNAIQKTYTDYVTSGRFMDISKLMEITNSSPAEDIIQKGYLMYLKDAKFISFTGLKKRTGIEPDQEMVLEMFWYYHTQLQESPADDEEMWLRRLRKLKQISGVEPPEDIALEMELD